MFETECIGLLTFESIERQHAYSEIEIKMLTIYSQMLVNVENRIRQEKKLTKAKEEAEAANIARSQFISTMSHEIRTPMNGILGFLQLLEMTETTEEQTTFMHNIKTSTDTLLELISDILDLSKIEAGKMEIDTIPFDLRIAVETAVLPFNTKANAKNVKLDVQIRPQVPQFVIGDSTKIRQVITNLVSNAVKFTDRGEIFVGVEQIGADEKADILRFTVRDTGIGMNDDVISKVFLPFIQADSSSTRKYGGSGLGLSLCKSIVDMMGGTIGLESEVGVGTTVTFQLSLERSEFAPEKKEVNLALFKGKRVMIVDDNLMNRDIAKIYLQEIGCMVGEAENASDAISQLVRVDEGAYDVALVDYNMPHMDGCELATTLKSIPFTKHIPLILLSSVSIGKEEMKASGFSDYLTKPYKRMQLLECIERVLDGDRCPKSQDRHKAIHAEKNSRSSLSAVYIGGG